MNDNYRFREIEKEEVSQMFSMIRQRMKWMDEKGIKQWNIVKYDEIYPQAYYEEERQKGEVFVLEDLTVHEIIGAAVLKEEDSRWGDKTPSIYIHNFVSVTGQKNAGTMFLQFAEDYARKLGKTYVRLDSAEDNPALAQYYGRHGFVPAGTCQEGEYRGILRQKEVNECLLVKGKQVTLS